MSDEPVFTEGSGNVYADLELPNPEERKTKAALACRISHAIAARGLTQAQAAYTLGVSQPHVSNLLRGRLSGFSVERLLHFLTLLGHDVQIIVLPTTLDHAHGQITVTD